ncbi:MAG: thioredoxin domain-containing protein, partial [Chloroflexota bacterium]|nr:thioredoxin domain-containing protein [Chloroflexota bacterium]
ALTGEPVYRTHAERALYPLVPLALRAPSGFGRALCALDDLIGPFYEVALIGAADDPRLAALRAEVAQRYQPRMAFAWGDPAAPAAVPLLAERGLVGDAPAAYVCQSFVCQRPVITPEELRALLAD